MKKTKTEESKKRTKFLFILIILTAVLSITTTYTWFTMRGDVELTKLKVNVEAAANMQISLDGENWTQSIEITDMQLQLYGSAKSGYKAYSQNSNYIPTGLSPVSTIGELDKLTFKPVFVYGTVKGNNLTDIRRCVEEGWPDKLLRISESTGRNACRNRQHGPPIFNI